MIEVLLFDLGGVLVEFSGDRDILPLLKLRASEDDVRARWRNCELTEAFGLGKLSRQEFGERFVRSWGLNVEPDQFLQEFRSWSRRLLPGAVELLALLRPRFRLAALSNSNELHWDRNTQDLGIEDLFELALSSHRCGLAKPAPEFYLLALERLGVSPDAVLFFDDVPANVAAASALGICAFHVKGVADVRARLFDAQIL
jgi:putative hydrolase of the HAD superfamily